MDASDAAERSGPIPHAGDVLQFAESDYCYGIGPLVLQVTGVGADLDRYPRLEWLSLRGVELRRDGSAGPERQVLVRTSALPRTT
ncbi:hypothetical protein I0C86_27320 [Plantactinospora sp. S1510]|uniref:Uncharacterized protein n=1 Tax=Plantactinospora alkalitolerans TaxID=2789879 RepID=A0ABS0H2G3_9ACTN|nr:hypothetical protein [Plantactinospora alkalitolerans]MBF9132636.1 hypothetical protein [Plantactinospora alkalitolerans]